MNEKYFKIRTFGSQVQLAVGKSNESAPPDAEFTVAIPKDLAESLEKTRLIIGKNIKKDGYPVTVFLDAEQSLALSLNLIESVSRRLQLREGELLRRIKQLEAQLAKNEAT